MGLILPFSDCYAKVKYKKATKIGLVKDDTSAAEKNYTLLQNAISQKRNVKLNGTFYVKFPKPIILDYTLHITGGEMRIVSGNCFDFVDGGGFVAENTVFRREDIDEGKALCGTWNLYGDILMDKFHFLNSKYYGCYLLQMSFEDLNSDETKFGINQIQVKDSYLYNGGRVLFLNGVIWEKCDFSNNTFESFPTTPIYIAYNHSKKRYPNESDTYEFVEKNYKKSVSVTIANNKFIGKPVSYNSYYCSALVQSVVCNFKNNYLKDIINYADGKSMSAATCYDAYLSCSEVYFIGNTIENMMSFSMNGGEKPQCEIGKSKIDLLRYEGSKTIRCYENNSYVVYGDKFLNMGADRNTLYTNIFENTDPVDTYIWNNNTVVYHQADLYSRNSSSPYKTFKFNNNRIEVSSIKNNGLCIIPSNEDFRIIQMTNNTFVLKESMPFYLFNQVNYSDSPLYIRGNIQIENNRFIGSSPKIIFSRADNIIIKNNETDASNSKSNYYIQNNSGAATPLIATNIDVALPYTSTADSGTSVVHLSTKSSGVFKQSTPLLTNNKALSGYLYLEDEKIIEFKISYQIASQTKEAVVSFDYKLGSLTCKVNGQNQDLNNDKYSVLLNEDGIRFQVRYTPSENKFFYYLTSNEVSKNDKDTLINLLITL